MLRWLSRSLCTNFAFLWCHVAIGPEYALSFVYSTFKTYKEDFKEPESFFSRAQLSLATVVKMVWPRNTVKGPMIRRHETTQKASHFHHITLTCYLFMLLWQPASESVPCTVQNLPLSEVMCEDFQILTCTPQNRLLIKCLTSIWHRSVKRVTVARSMQRELKEARNDPFTVRSYVQDVLYVFLSGRKSIWIECENPKEGLFSSEMVQVCWNSLEKRFHCSVGGRLR